MPSLRHLPGNFLNMRLHASGIDAGENKTGRCSPIGTDRTVNIGVYKPPLPDSPRTAPFFSPYSRYAALPPDTGFVLKPYIDIGRINIIRQTAYGLSAEVFLKSSRTCSSCSGCRERRLIHDRFRSCISL
jgi:hypothetical protein